jgi:hypothetical protein
VLISAISYQPPAFAQGTAFTYQGRLNDGANPASGIYDLRFAIYDALSGGVQQGSLLTNSPTAVTNGLFTVTLDFGNQFPGANRWLEIAVRTNGGGAFSTLNPRQSITATPYAMTAGNISGTLSNANLGGTYSGSVTLNNSANNFSGTFSGNGAGLTNLNAWRLGGNAGTTAGTHFLGTTDNQPLEIKVNGQRGLRLEENSGFGAVNIIGGSLQNVIGGGVIGATISGGGTTNAIGFPSINSIYSSFGSVGGGKFNRIAPLSEYSTISGGAGNSVGTNSQSSTISGGGGGFIGNESEYCSIGGGVGNQIKSQSSLSTIAGGYLNQIGTNSGSGVIGGGFANNIYSNSTSATIAGGIQNTIGTNSGSSVIGGGANNVVTANANYATIPGGLNNAATNHAYAAGRRAKAIHPGAFVWADSTDADFASTTTNQFNLRAAGGLRLSDTTPGIYFGTTIRQMLNLWSTNFAIGVQDSTTYFRSDSIFAWFRGGQHTNSGPGAGGSTLMTLNSSGLAVNGTFVSSSDRNVKQDFTPVNALTVLEKVIALPLSEWSYRHDEQASRHLGPMAQDFRAAFGLGADEKHIATVDADGVAFAAIQGLNQKLEEQKAENAALKARLEKLEALIEKRDSNNL